MEDRKEAISLEKDEAINGIVRDRAGRAIISFQSGLLSVKLSICITIIVIAILVIVIIIIIIFLTLSRAVADTDNKILINLV